MKGHGKWDIFQAGWMPASVNRIKNKKRKTLDKPGEPNHGPAEPIHRPPPPLLAGSGRHRRRCRIRRQGACLTWICCREALRSAGAVPDPSKAARGDGWKREQGRIWATTARSASRHHGSEHRRGRRTAPSRQARFTALSPLGRAMPRPLGHSAAPRAEREWREGEWREEESGGGRGSLSEERARGRNGSRTGE
jgi:hypothetical protein